MATSFCSCSRRFGAALAVLAASASAWAQTTGALAPVTITAREQAPLDLGGFGDAPRQATPLSTQVIDAQAITHSGARRLADLLRFDASTTDAYNAPGYWDFVNIRGFALDNRFNFRRDGLPISAETAIPLDNKAGVEILKGLSGIQAGVSAPGGLVNYAVKRPGLRAVRDVRVEWTERNSTLMAADLSGRAGVDQGFGWRLNLAHEQLRPQVRNLDGTRQLAALATQWRLNRDTLLDAEIEWSHKRQPSQQAYSLLGSALPALPDPRLNLNNQPWSQPSVFDALNASLKLETALNPNWRATLQAGTQRLRSDDRLAYAFGCSSDEAYDRFCRDGSFDLYDFRSENERRHAHSGRISLQGRVEVGAWEHQIGISLLAASRVERFQDQAFNWVGTGDISGTRTVPADPSLTDANTHRDERWLELSLTDAIRIDAANTLWLGLRQTDLRRSSLRTDGSRPASYAQSITTPWLGYTHQWAAGPMAYISAGQGIESQIVPNKPSQYTNAGVALPALRSRQIEIGLRQGFGHALRPAQQQTPASAGGAGGAGGASPAEGAWNGTWQVALFRVHRPMSNLDACNHLGLTPCTGEFDGEAVHTGLEASVSAERGAWQWGLGAMALNTRRQGSRSEPELNGKRIANVPRAAARAHVLWRVPAATGLALRADLSAEGRRPATPDGSIQLPAWARVDAAVEYSTQTSGHPLQWRLGIDNIANRRYWREAPYQFGHIYLYPGAPRTLRLSLTASL